MAEYSTEAADDINSQWFDEAHIVDPDWIELTLTTKDGTEARYRVPRRTRFETVDSAADHSPL